MKIYNQWFHKPKAKSNQILIKIKFLKKKINCKLIEDKPEAIFRIVKKKRISFKIKTWRIIFKKGRKVMNKKSNCKIYN